MSHVLRNYDHVMYALSCQPSLLGGVLTTFLLAGFYQMR
jgi:hypothetical protein